MPEHTIKFEKAFKILEKEKEDSNFVKYCEEDDHGNKRLGPQGVSYWLTVSVFIKFFKGFYETTTKISGYLYVTSNVGYKKINKIQFFEQIEQRQQLYFQFDDYKYENKV